MAAEKKGKNDVVLQISEQEAASESSPKLSKDSSFELTELKRPKSRPETPITNKSPKFPTGPVSVSQLALISMSTISKPKSRLVEPPHPGDMKPSEEKARLKSGTSSPFLSSSNVASSLSNRVTAASSKDHQKSAPVTPTTPQLKTPPGEEEEEEDDEEVYKTASLKARQYASKKGKMKVTLLIEWISFVCMKKEKMVSYFIN